MSIIIEDGKGSGRSAGVDIHNHLQTAAVTRTEMSRASQEDGEAFIFATGAFTAYTSAAGEGAVLYIKNTSTTRLLHIHSLRTCATQQAKWIMYKGTTGGDIVTTATAGTKENINLTSSATAEATVYRGADNDTQTGGTFLSQWINNAGHSLEEYQGAVILGQSDTLCLTVAVTTNGDVCARFLGYFEDKE